jgi:general stress protein YciG
MLVILMMADEIDPGFAQYPFLSNATSVFRAVPGSDESQNCQLLIFGIRTHWIGWCLTGRWGAFKGETYMANEQRGGSGNFANDPGRASEAGKKGGQQSQSGGSPVQQCDNEKRGGTGNFANDPQRASEAGRKGGQS